MGKCLSLASAGALGDARLLLKYIGAARPVQPRVLRGKPPNTTQDAFEQAMAEYTRCNWRAAWELLAHLADDAHPVAARLALDMHRFGPRLFGGAFRADAGRLAAWARSINDSPAHDCEQLLRP